MKLTILAAAIITAAFLCPAVHAQAFSPQTLPYNPGNEPLRVDTLPFDPRTFDPLKFEPKPFNPYPGDITPNTAQIFAANPATAQSFVTAEPLSTETPQNSPAFVFAAPDTQTSADPSETASTEAWEAFGVTVASLLIFHSHSGDGGGMNTAGVVPVPEQNTGLTFGLLGACGYIGAAWAWRKKRSHVNQNQRRQLR